MTYLPFELHTHTCHSDGSFRVEELLRAAKSYGYSGLAMTDHNTMSGLREVSAAPGLAVIPGIEWTTYFGHMLVLGASRLVDWRFATPDTIDESLKQIRQANGVVGVAHPFRVGSPICTGCHWDFKVQDWSLVHYIEVWSLHTPQMRKDNELARRWWTSLLNAGHRLAVTAGRDWHGPDQEKPLLAATWLGIEEDKATVPGALAALRSGRTYVSVGPELEVEFAVEGIPVQLGDTLPNGAQVKLCLCVEQGELNAEHRIQPQKMVLVSGGQSREVPLEYGGADCLFAAEETWYRVEVYGAIDGVQNQLLAMTSPVYVAPKSCDKK